MKKKNESFGRNQFSSNTNPIQYHQTAEVDVSIYPAEGKFHAQVTVPSDDDLSSPLRVFATEQEAQHFARQYTEFVAGVLNQRSK